jgi:hypothetical protein
MNNKFKIIEVSDYILAVSDEEIINASYIYNSALNIVEKNNEFNNGILQSRIIAYQPKGNAPELDLPLLPEIVVEDDVEKLADLFSIDESKVHPADSYIAKKGFIEGYKAATKTFSEEDLRKAIDFVVKNYTINSFGNFPHGVSTDNLNYSEPSTKIQEKFILALKQPKTPKWFVAEMQTYPPIITETHIGSVDPYELKTTIIDGKTFLVGTYLYE